MATRKGKGRQAVRNRKGGIPGWAWALGAFALGAVVMAVLMHRSLLPMAPTGPRPNPQATARPDSDTGLQPGAADSTAKKPQYDFYSVLSEKEVRIPDDEVSARARAERRQKQEAMRQAEAAQQAAQRAAAAHAAASEDVTAAPKSALPTPAAASGYLLQVGAFPDADDAEALKAKLALQGFVANVQTVDVGGQTFHRVRLGPFRSATQLQDTQHKLATAGYRTIALKAGH